MSKTYDVAVVGLGTMGSSACYHLARRGLKVLGLEQFDIPNALGAHHGHSRMIRMAYFEHPDYVPLLQRAYELWSELETQANTRLLHLTGGLYMAPPESPLIKGSLASAKTHDLAYELLSCDDIKLRYPPFQIPDHFVGFFESKAGFLIPEKVVAAHIELALRAGAQLQGHEPVRGWQEDGSAVEVRTDRGTYRAKHVIFSGGAWSNQLLTDLGVPLTVTRQIWAWFWPKDPDRFSLGRFPCWFIETEPDFGHYGFPMMPDSPGFKIAHHKPGVETSPDQVVRELLPGDEQSLRPVLQRYIPDADGSLLAIRVCLYTNSPDSFFIIDRHPRHSRVTLACGFSGHGFKFGSVVGEALADLATQGQTELPIQFLGLSRFA